MIKKLIATPFQVIFRSEGSLENQIENHKENIYFQRYKSQNKDVDLELQYSKSISLC
jgi:hypothetical protein